MFSTNIFKITHQIESHRMNSPKNFGVWLMKNLIPFINDFKCCGYIYYFVESSLSSHLRLEKLPLKMQALKFIYFEKATKFCEISIYFWLPLHRTKVRWRSRKILWPSQNTWTIQNTKQIIQALCSLKLSDWGYKISPTELWKGRFFSIWI